jgi:hypothetical protein
MMWVTTLKQDPVRVKNWRKKLIDHCLVSGKSVPKSCQDEYLRMGYEYYKMRNRSLSMGLDDIMKLQSKFPHMHTAYQIFTARDYFRYILEAMVVADVPVEDIAKEFGCDPEVVTIFEELFFDVRSRLNAPMFIADELLGPLFSSDTANSQDCDFLWKAVAYYCGIDILKSFWSLEKASPETVSQIREMFKTRLQQQAFSSLYARTPNNFNAHEIVEEYLAVEETEEPEEESTQNKLEEHALDLLNSIQSRITPYKAKKGKKEGRCLANDLPEEDTYDRTSE